tara:strand:- start:2525 stop:3118 length:594 start_codon:yes stop_codon:yes gene_type:complete
MKNLFKIIIISILFYSCQKAFEKLPVIDNDGYVNVLIEIPSGTLEKWELNKDSGIIERDYKNGKPRTINYLGYPANYGMIPNTLSNEELGGDGDPLDILVLGSPINKGELVKVKVIGMIEMLDNGQKDDKFIAVKKNDLIFSKINKVQEIKENFPGLLKILKLWFENYKGINQIQVTNIYDKSIANEILLNSIISEN